MRVKNNYKINSRVISDLLTAKGSGISELSRFLKINRLLLYYKLKEQRMDERSLLGTANFLGVNPESLLRSNFQISKSPYVDDSPKYIDPNKIIRIINEKGLTREEIGKRMMIKPKSFNSWISSYGKRRRSCVEKMAAILNVQLEEILSDRYVKKMEILNDSKTRVNVQKVKKLLIGKIENKDFKSVEEEINIPINDILFKKKGLTNYGNTKILAEYLGIGVNDIIIKLFPSSWEI